MKEQLLFGICPMTEEKKYGVTDWLLKLPPQSDSSLSLFFFFLAVLSLHCDTWGLFTVEHGLLQFWHEGSRACKWNNCGAWA